MKVNDVCTAWDIARAGRNSNIVDIPHTKTHNISSSTKQDIFQFEIID